MRLYRQKDSNVWWIDIASNGQRIRKSTGTTNKKKAEDILAKVRTEILEGKWFGVDQSKTRTLGEMIERYLTERSAHKSLASFRRDKSCFSHFKNFFGDCTLASITPSGINEFKQKRLQAVDPQTVVKELGVLRNAFNIAIKEWEWCKDNPVSRVSMPKVPQGRVRYLSVEEINNLIENADEWFRPVLTCAFHTGMRQGNIISLTWDKVDFFRRVILLDKTKNEERQAVPINGTLMETLKQLDKVRLLHCNLVFHQNGIPLYQKQLQRALDRACKKTGIEDFRFHDLRHCFASLLIQSGEDLYTVQKMLGHKDSRMTQRYAHLSQEKLHTAACNLDRICHNSGIVGEQKSEVCAVTA